MAIDELLDEREQGERVKAWLRDNSLGLIGGLVLGGALIFGWQYWKTRSQTLAMEQHAAYQAAVRGGGAGQAAKSR